MIVYGKRKDCFFLHIDDPLKRINLLKPVRMGELEEKIMMAIKDIYACEKIQGVCCTDFSPGICVQHILQFKQVSPHVLANVKIIHEKMVM